jgi:hypothetical protein
MLPRSRLDKLKFYFESVILKNSLSKCLIILSVFLLAVLLISYIFPIINFGRFLGTDDYTHLYHTKVMASSNGISDFYDKIGATVSDPSNQENLYNYPFGLWLFGATIAKITGLPILSAEFLFVILFLCILIGSFCIYCGIFLKSREQQIMAVLFLLCMPNAATSLLSFRPSVFILPFLFILLYITLKKPFQWKLLPIVWLSIFVITISHTGSFIFLICFSVLYLLLYCLLWGKFSKSMFMVIISTLVIYIFSLKLFPQIANQFEVKSTLFLAPGEFFASKFNISFILDLGNIFYQNMIVNQDLMYAIILGAFVFTGGKLLQYIHQKISERFSPSERAYAFTLPISNISHSVGSVPIWLGPIHVLLSLFGFFQVDSRGKCVFITAFIVGVLPDLLFETSSATGALREISYLTIIIPITAVLGFWAVISYLDTTKNTYKNLVSLAVWVLVLMIIVITPILATTYYLPRIAGDDYVIDGMKWLGDTGKGYEKVSGLGYRTIPVYTNMSDAGYGVPNGYETRTYLKLLKNIYFSSAEDSVAELRKYYGVQYILTSDKVTSNLGGNSSSLKIDENKKLDKIYSSKDFGVYEVIRSPKQESEEKSMGENISYQLIGSSIQIKTEQYSVVLNSEYPIMERFGTQETNYLGDGFINDNIRISGLRSQPDIDPFNPSEGSDLRKDSTVDLFTLDSVPASYEIYDNQIIYKTVLKDAENNESTLLVRYTFYPTTIKREFMISNDWVNTPVASQMTVYFSTTLFVPSTDFIIKSDKSDVKRHVYPSQDNVVMSEIVKALYIYDDDRGIYIKIEPTSPYPSSLSYKGSTLYNMSNLGITQTGLLKPGATLHITQYLTPGTEVMAENNILTQEGISLLNYPDGIVPIILSDYRMPLPNSSFNETIASNETIAYKKAVNQGYQILRDEGVPYSEIVVADRMREISSTQAIAKDIPKLIGSGSTGSPHFDSNGAQDNSISSLINSAFDENTEMIGYMPSLLNYNLDTLEIVSDKKIPFMISDVINAPQYGSLEMERRDPQMAIYHSESLDVVLLPVSEPVSTALSNQTDNTRIFSAWKAIIDAAVIKNEMVLFIIRSQDIGNPGYSEDIKTLIEYAKKQGLTFTTPDVIVNHYKKIQNIQFSGAIDGDIAVINMTNNNDDMVQRVAFKVILPKLKNGNYKVLEGTIVKTSVDNDRVILYISTDISAHTTKEITIEPSLPKEKLLVTLPQQPVEGQVSISIQDMNGNPLPEAYVIFDSKYYKPDEEGYVKIDSKRGLHNIQIRCPGFEKYSTTINVKGRIFAIEPFISKLIP